MSVEGVKSLVVPRWTVLRAPIVHRVFTYFSSWMYFVHLKYLVREMIQSENIFFFSPGFFCPFFSPSCVPGLLADLRQCIPSSIQGWLMYTALIHMLKMFLRRPPPPTSPSFTDQAENFKFFPAPLCRLTSANSPWNPNCIASPRQLTSVDLSCLFLSLFLQSRDKQSTKNVTTSYGVLESCIPPSRRNRRVDTRH